MAQQFVQSVLMPFAKPVPILSDPLCCMHKLRGMPLELATCFILVSMLHGCARDCNCQDPW